MKDFNFIEILKDAYKIECENLRYFVGLKYKFYAFIFTITLSFLTLVFGDGVSYGNKVVLFGMGAFILSFSLFALYLNEIKHLNRLERINNMADALSLVEKGFYHLYGKRKKVSSETKLMFLLIIILVIINF